MELTKRFPRPAVRSFIELFALCALLAGGVIRPAQASDYIVYNVFRPLDLGEDESGGSRPKDFYVNMGSSNGVRSGTVLEVLRKVSTFDLSSQKLYKDVLLPVAKIKVIHVESNAAVARLEKLAPPELTPGISPRAVMVGDMVRLAR
jgi:hypothetical protein